MQNGTCLADVKIKGSGSPASSLPLCRPALYDKCSAEKLWDASPSDMLASGLDVSSLCKRMNLQHTDPVKTAKHCMPSRHLVCHEGELMHAESLAVGQRWRFMWQTMRFDLLCTCSKL